ncbi:MAG TPA: SDR family oxidoreductase [Actinomycetota bacterium]
MGALEGKVIVVTGASRGLGEAMATGYAGEGATLVLAARTVDDLERVQKACLAAGAAGATVVQTDITDESQVEQLVDGVITQAGRIDVFVANAATSYGMLTDKKYRELHTYDADIVEQLLRVNVVGTWLCMKHALPKMQPGSSFIAIGSETGRALYPGAGFYAITKATTDALATLASREMGQAGVRVNVLSPGGMVDTQLFGPTGMPEWLKEQHPPLPAEVIVPAAVWLADADSADVSGALVSGKAFNETGPEGVRASLPAARH